jgi:hypothetical protein
VAINTHARASFQKEDLFTINPKIPRGLLASCKDAYMLQKVLLAE